MFEVCTAGDTAHIDTIFKFLSHTRQHNLVPTCTHLGHQHRITVTRGCIDTIFLS